MEIVQELYQCHFLCERPLLYVLGAAADHFERSKYHCTSHGHQPLRTPAPRPIVPWSIIQSPLCMLPSIAGQDMLETTLRQCDTDTLAYARPQKPPLAVTGFDE